MTHADEKQRTALLRAILAFCVVAAVLVAALFATIGALNKGIYSAGGFVGQYLDALARADTEGALALDGVQPTEAQLDAAGLPSDLPTTLLRASVLGDLTDISLASDVETESGSHTVVYDFKLDGRTSSMQFSVEPTGKFGGVFDSWRFATSPIAALAVSVQHESTFTVNGLTLDTRAHAVADAPASFNNAATYLAFAPSVYTFQHDSALLTAPPVALAVTQPGVTEVSVEAVPNEAFTQQVQDELNKFLDTECVAQTVLQPTGCRFGMDINNRVLNAPTWTIAEYPVVALTPGEVDFEMPDTAGQAHINVKVQSLFDGSIVTRDEDVPFTMGLSVTIQPSGALAIQLH
ncbi:hypothetical protein [Cryobacterium psychrophilum]|uniref:Uncharacterized protein n=1 Tax=Cryobacterium psychrophilum TaxID=41988 RepID=A0A4Y8KKM3_9MICO|nr:hypothetical protein [Cryobacterium psychrophilum]TDW30150.1 hypothetical protein EDD25_1893 [Cryobacterium psychrophilum]TFD77382.1 hypothetical protein E3T53_11175 [Cryobacterium psychrophilum]